MYWISDAEQADKLVKRAKDVETKIKSNCIKEDENKTKDNIYLNEILEDIAIEDLIKYDIPTITTDNLIKYGKITIIYSKSNLNEELDHIIELYNYIPEIHNHRYAITQIKYKNIILVIDPNIEQGMTYKDVRNLCKKTEVEFTNQSMSHLVKQLKIRFFDSKPQRHQLNKEERQERLEDAGGCCASCKKEINKIFDIDHIIPLSEGGTNDAENLQVLCKPCHFEKTKIAVADFSGVKRRFEYIIKNEKMVYIDDYAHHPEELRMLISSAKTLFKDKKVSVIFQPHLFTRTRDFAEGFAESLDLADEVILLDIYPARELPLEGVSSQIILDKMSLNNRHILSKESTLKWAQASQLQVLITAGAGDIDTIIEPLKQILSEK